jgi:hypothetical protein
MTQPIAIKMDPRVKITPEVQQIFTLTTQMEDNARNAAAAYKDARALADKVKARPQSAANDALLKELAEIAPVEVADGGGGGVVAVVAEAVAGGGGGGRGTAAREFKHPRRSNGGCGARDAGFRDAPTARNWWHAISRPPAP